MQPGDSGAVARIRPVVFVEPLSVFRYSASTGVAGGVPQQHLHHAPVVEAEHDELLALGSGQAHGFSTHPANLLAGLREDAVGGMAGGFDPVPVAGGGVGGRLCASRNGE